MESKEKFEVIEASLQLCDKEGRFKNGITMLLGGSREDMIFKLNKMLDFLNNVETK